MTLCFLCAPLLHGAASLVFEVRRHDLKLVRVAGAAFVTACFAGAGRGRSSSAGSGPH